MAGSLTNAAELKILDHINGVTSWTPTAPLKVALYTAAPTESSSGTEVSGGSYARQTITFGAASSGQATNSSGVTFPTATASWGTIVAVAVFDSAAVMIWYGTLNAAKTIDADDTFSLPAGNVTISLD